jgi:hypothetical protein
VGSAVAGADTGAGAGFWLVELWLAATPTTETTFVWEITSSPGLLILMMITTFDCCGCTAAAAALAAWSVAACWLVSVDVPSGEGGSEPAV